MSNVYYYDIPESLANAKTVKEIMNKIDDPYTQYYTSEEFKNYRKI